MEQQDDKGMPGESYISGPFHQAITQKEKTFDLWRSTALIYCHGEADRQSKSRADKEWHCSVTNT